MSKKEEKIIDKKSSKKRIKKVKSTKKSYFAEIKAEMKQVKWPTKELMLKYGIAVVIAIVLFAVYFYGLDALFTWIVSLVKGL